MEKITEMTATVLFDGEVLRLETPIELEPNARYTIKLSKNLTKAEEGTEDAWDVLERLIGTVDAPADWSAEHDHYIHGGPKRTEIQKP
ncbi:MAG: hypothetical protein NVSMB14_06470 [Isosphaeraceae bacterium]